MDRKSILILGVCFGLLLLWPRLVTRILPPQPLPPGATNVVVVTATNSAGTITAVTTPAPAPAAVSPVATHLAFDTNAPEHLLVATNDGARYIFTSLGGGLKSIELLKYPETVSPIRKKRVTVIYDVATLNDSAPLPVGALLDNGTAQGDGVFALTRTATGVRAEKVLENGLRVTKDFDFSSNYLVTATVRLQNGGAAAVALPAREIAIGTATTPAGQNQSSSKGRYGYTLGTVWYDGVKPSAAIGEAWFANRSAFSCVTGSQAPRTEYREGTNNVIWAATENQFFTILAMPEKPAQQVVVRPVVLPRDADAPAEAPAQQGYETTLVFPATNLSAGQIAEQKIIFFAGPKEYRTLARIADSFNNNADLVMGFNGFFGWFARAMLLAMNWLHDFLRLPYGWAIIVFTLTIKIVFWPLTAASTRSMKRMQALQPQMNAIKEKYKDDAVKMNQKTMAFMKENKVNPMGGCLPMVIQLPILWGFVMMMRSAIELRGAPFLWVGDLSQPDTLFVIQGLGGIPFFGIPNVGLPINVLPLLMGATQVWQMSLMPPSPGVDPGQQKMMRLMPLMFLLFMYNLSAGLALYWTVQNLLSVLQTKLTKTDPAKTAPVKAK